MVYAVKDLADFNAQLEAAGGKLVVVDFFATWCPPCKMIAPHLEEISKTMSDVVVLKVDVDDCEDVAAEYKVAIMEILSPDRVMVNLLLQITAMPTFIFFKSKAKIADMTGANVEKLKEIVASNK